MEYFQTYLGSIYLLVNKSQQQVSFRNLRQRLWLIAVAVFILVLLFMLIIISGRYVQFNQTPLSPIQSEADTVVLYVFGGNDPYYQGNLLYFLLHGILPNVDYVIVLQDGWAKVSRQVSGELKRVPRNVKIVTHPNQCFDWGTYGWYLKKHLDELRSTYKYIIFMNSSIRGPFYTSYEEQDWVDIMKGQLNSQKDIKLYGPSINCELFRWHEIKKGQHRYNPHVQSYLVLMDFETLDILLGDPYIFQCHTRLEAAIHYAELGSSLTVLEAGYNIGSLLLRYQGIDWRKKENWKCNGNRNPTIMYYYDSLNMPPLEALFVKVKSAFRGTRSLPIRLGLWQELIRNEALDPETSKGIELKNQRTGSKEMYFRQNKHCWDVIYYQIQNQDLKVQGIFRPKQLWEHFVNEGYIQGRAYRFAC
eukprot:TRINITY_DN2182_c0_g1_i3.p1 TRINITY_DN2182_c0_g1~~TRINITY_DN2182_c0_g1_i3.p1  ORF type:complete len:427 (+),score=16.21 TRINITY_DN2182_c0_g1_i3:28-1281(+)